MHFVRFILRVTVTISLIVVVLLLGLALALGWGLGLAWVLQRWLPLTLFEGAILVYVATYGVSWLITRIWEAVNDRPKPWEEEDEAEEDEEDSAEFIQSFLPIPVKRFTQAANGATWEAWVRFTLANMIYIELTATPDVVGYLGRQQQQELSIRLADIIIPILRRHKSKSSLPRLSIAALKQQMDAMNQQPYEDDLLLLAVRTANAAISIHENLADVVMGKLWAEPCAIPDWDTS